jgi:hypothetical protein
MMKRKTMTHCYDICTTVIRRLRDAGISIPTLMIDSPTHDLLVEALKRAKIESTEDDLAYLKEVYNGLESH